MGRIRTIKPEFWQNEALSALPESVHILAAALLNYADDEGYFNANPMLVKAACFPLREPSVSIHGGLKALCGIDYIRVGKGADGKTYGVVVKFEEHQRVNRPSKSKIATISIAWDAITDYSVNNHGEITEDSLTEQGTGNREQGTGNRELVAVAPLSSADDAAHAVEAWNDAAKRQGWPMVQRLTDPRKKAITARLREAGGAEGWAHAIAKAESSDFLCGRSRNGFSGFGIDWIIKPANFTKLMEGNYDNRIDAGRAGQFGSEDRGAGRDRPGAAMADAFAAVAERKQREFEAAKRRSDPSDSSFPF